MSKQKETMYPKLIKVMEFFTKKGRPYCKVQPVCTVYREMYPDHYKDYANPQKSCRDNVQGRLNEMVDDPRWPVKCRNKAYLVEMGYPDHTFMYYLSDRPEPPPPLDDASDVA